MASSNPFATTALTGGSASSTFAQPLGGFSYQPLDSGSKVTGASGAGTNPLDLQATMDDLLGFQSKATELKAASDASLLSVEGANAEADAYAKEGALATGNAQTEALAEQVRSYQIDRGVDKVVGGQSAAVAANGFQQSGSAIDIMRSSYQQGHLQSQLSAMTSEETQRGFLESAAAAEGEQTAAKLRATGAQQLSDAQLSASNSATANATALTGAMTQLLAGDTNAQALVTALTTGDTAGALAATATYNPGGPGAPLTNADAGPVLYAGGTVAGIPAPTKIG